MPLARREHWKKTTVVGEGHELCRGQVESGVALRHPRDVEQAAEYIGVRFKTPSRDTHLSIVHMWMEHEGRA